MLRTSTRKHRRGATAVEMAVTLPVVFAFFYASFEFARIAMIRHTADNAVYEAARVGVLPGAKSGDVRRAAELVLSTVGVRNVQINVNPAQIRPETKTITVDIRVPLDNNLFLPGRFTGGKTVVRTLTLAREGI